MDAMHASTDDLLRSRLRRSSTPQSQKVAGRTSYISDVRPVTSGYHSRIATYGRTRPTRNLAVTATPSAPAPAPQAKPESPYSIQPVVRRVQVVPAKATEETLPPAAAAASPQIIPKKTRLLKKPSVATLLIVAAIFIFAVGSFVAFDSWRTNRAAEAAVKEISTKPTAVQKQDNQPTPETAPATNAPSQSDIDGYAVAPTRPRIVTIPKIGVKARIVPEGVAKDGSLAAPANVYDTGWYTSSSLPGQAGAMLLDGHVSSWTTNGVFYNLKKLVAGDTISVERGDGKVLQYQVVKTQSYDAAAVDMQAAVTPVVPGKPGLNLITCTGKVKPGTSEFSQRLIVFTKQVT